MSLKRYRKALQRLKPKVVVLETKVNEAGNSLTVNYKITPPFNTFAVFEHYTNASDLSAGDTGADVKIPESFSWWREYYDFFPPDEQDKPQAVKVKTLSSKISSAPDQGACGSCWAVSVASCISDNILIKQSANNPPDECQNPRLSSTYLLSCSEQYECLGGSTLDALKYVEQNGIATVNCIDYSWLQMAKNCPMDELSRSFTFDTNILTMNESVLESTVVNALDAETETCRATIPDCGCYANPEKHRLFTVSDPQAVQCLQESDIQSIKRRILLKGPIIGNFAVKKNFQDAYGNFKESGDVYIDIAKYTTIETASEKEIIPGHAVVIVGWGKKTVSFTTQSDIKIGPVDVEYWIARNSWGISWGRIQDQPTRGYFLMAMRQQVTGNTSQIGDLSCLEYPVDVTIDNKAARVGGLVTFSIPDVYMLPTTPQDTVDTTGELRQDGAFYEADVKSSIFSAVYKKALDAEYIRAKNTRFVVMLIVVMLFATLLYFY